MSNESRQRLTEASSSYRGTKRSQGIPPDQQSCKFGTVVRALWPIKPALNLSQRVGCTERHANLLIKGKRKPNARVALAVYAEIIDPD